MEDPDPIGFADLAELLSEERILQPRADWAVRT